MLKGCSNIILARGNKAPYKPHILKKRGQNNG